MDMLMSGVSRLAQYGEAISYDSYALKPGGKGANQAVALAKFGLNSHLVGTIGDDEYGKLILKNLGSYGVNTTGVLVNPQVNTGLASIIIEKETARYAAYVALGGNDHIQPEQVEKALTHNEIHMVVMQLEMPLETVYRTYELAKERNIPVFLDAGPAMKISLERLRGIFVISPNEAEAFALSGIDVSTEENAEKAAKKIYEEAKPQYVILKLGSKGALVYDGKEAKLIPGFKVEAVDTTGAGDTFNAAFLTSYCKGKSMEGAITFAHGAAGLSVTKQGGMDSIPNLEETKSFLEERV